MVYGYFRTSVEGEPGYARITAYDVPETIKITNPNEYCGISLSIDTPMYTGVTYKISYDIRCSKEDAAMVARSYLGTDSSSPLHVDGETYDGSKFMYWPIDFRFPRLMKKSVL